MSGPYALPQLRQRRQRAGLPQFVDDGAGWSLMPVGSLEDIDEIDVKRLIGLTHLPVLDAAALFQFLAEAANPIG